MVLLISQKNMTVRRLRSLAERIREEAGNLSPTAGAHPAPLLRQWAETLDDIAATVSGK